MGCHKRRQPGNIDKECDVLLRKKKKEDKKRTEHGDCKSEGKPSKATEHPVEGGAEMLNRGHTGLGWH